MLENCFKTVLPFLNSENDLIITNFFNSIKGRLYKNKILWKYKSQFINDKQKFISSTLPLCKFYKTNILYSKLPYLEEKIPYQDQILYQLYALYSNKVFYLNKFLGVYTVERDGSTMAAPWNEFRVNTLIKNNNFLSSFENPYLNGQVLVTYYYIIWNTKKLISKFNNVKIENSKKITKAKCYFMPFGINFFQNYFMF